MIKKLLVLLLLLMTPSCQQTAPSVKSTPPPRSTLEQNPGWWRAARFGLFIHWGPVSLQGTEIGWSRKGKRPGRSGTGTVPIEIYDNLYKEFNPTRFDADEWVALAKDAGMKYLVFTTKHHDGFCMFDSALTDYKITNSPFKRDIVGELARACQRGGLKLGFYYSQPDWHHPDYRSENHHRYIKYLHGQIRELCTNYGKVDIIWFDGLGGKPKDWDTPKLYKMIRELQPGVLINNRAGIAGDFRTPEQRVGQFDRSRPWESCITICRQWAYKPQDQMKSLDQSLGLLTKCAGGDGNLLFNVGPMPDGSIEPRQVLRLLEMGRWLDKYGKSIYGTRGGPYKPWPGGSCTHRGNTIYLHLTAWGEDGLTLQPLGRDILAHQVLTGGKVEIRQDKQELRILPNTACRKQSLTIIALKLKDDAASIPPLRHTPPSGSLTTGKKASASNFFRKRERYNPAKAIDDDPLTRWATDGGTKTAWLQVHLGKPHKVGRALIQEVYDRVEAFTIEALVGDNWQTCCQGQKIGPDCHISFEPIMAHTFRLNITRASEGPTISEFQLFPPAIMKPK